MSEPVVLDAVATQLVRVASAERDRLMDAARTQFAGRVQCIVQQHAIGATNVAFVDQPDGTITLEIRE